MRVDIADSLAEVTAPEWNALNPAGYPFLRHEFLNAAEITGCVSPETGWQPRHLLGRDGTGRLVAAMPLYEKTHSWGEFVFDWAWASAYGRAGLPYYPKLVSAAPFTPATSHRILCAEAGRAEATAALVEAALALAEESEQSSLHIQFPRDDELPALEQAGLKLRKDCQFHWHNRGYADFDEFLQQFSSRKRKKARRDRRAVAEQGIRFRWLRGEDMTAELWRVVYALISATFMRRGCMPYFSLEFFRSLGEDLPGNVLVVLAEMRGRTVAAALCFVGADRLYGRYWGSDGHYDALHFETCYYQGIEYCIEHGLAVFEPGTQGEHKISRGFTPVTTWSAHWLAHDRFFDAIGRYLEEEQLHIERYIETVDEHSPYRRTGMRKT